jgi:hypothetical protein
MSIPRERTSTSLIAPAPRRTDSGFRRNDCFWTFDEFIEFIKLHAHKWLSVEVGEEPTTDVQKNDVLGIMPERSEIT